MDTDKILQEHGKQLDRLNCAIYGDPRNSKTKGMQEMITEVHGLVVKYKFTGKFILIFFGGISVVAGGIYTFIKVIKSLATG